MVATITSTSSFKHRALEGRGHPWRREHPGRRNREPALQTPGHRRRRRGRLPRQAARRARVRLCVAQAGRHLQLRGHDRLLRAPADHPAVFPRAPRNRRRPAAHAERQAAEVQAPHRRQGFRRRGLSAARRSALRPGSLMPGRVFRFFPLYGMHL